ENEVPSGAKQDEPVEAEVPSANQVEAAASVDPAWDGVDSARPSVPFEDEDTAAAPVPSETTWSTATDTESTTVPPDESTTVPDNTDREAVARNKGAQEPPVQRDGTTAEGGQNLAEMLETKLEGTYDEDGTETFAW
ncbi:unnamed protein product, partial [Amoebophrya sp. A25]